MSAGRFQIKIWWVFVDADACLPFSLPPSSNPRVCEAEILPSLPQTSVHLKLDDDDVFSIRPSCMCPATVTAPLAAADSAMTLRLFSFVSTAAQDAIHLGCSTSRG
jgi:hypothetical protein